MKRTWCPYQAMLEEYPVMMDELADEYEIAYQPLKSDQRSL
ncbi:MAG: hypothetical protein ACQEUT_08410 [Bacillota bacterium]